LTSRTGGAAIAALLAAAIVTAAVASGCSSDSARSGSPSRTTGPGTSGAPGTSGPPLAAAYPTSPPARICGDHAVLDGPATAPAGAVTIPTTTNLNDATQSQPPGTTFWLAPGTHTLGTGEFGQVVPKDRDTYIGAPGAILDGQKLNRYAFTQHAVGVTIATLTVQNFGVVGGNHDEGVVNHDAGAGWTVHGLTIQGSSGAGLFVGSHDVIEDNCLQGNGQYGFSMFDPQGITDITIRHNEVVGNNADDWEKRIAQCGCSGGGKFWDVRGAKIVDNWIHDNKGVGLWADTNDVAFDIEGNYIDNNASEGIIYEISYNALIRNNTITRNALVKGREFEARGDNFPVAALYISESGGDARVDPRYPTLEISGNNFADNWGGVTLWENADRFCGSPNNTSGRYCTLGGIASAAVCTQATITEPARYADCRWHTQNVKVTGNRFTMNKSAIGCHSGCGRQAILSNFGTSPTWSPYQGRVIQDAITFKNNNRFVGNHYVGDWQFMARDTDGILTFAQWQASPYGQDEGSSIGQ
jgi:hypothetical protein